MNAQPVGLVNCKKMILPIVIGILLIVLGFAVIIGWIFHISRLISVFPGYVAMVVNTSICFIITGLALIFATDVHSQLFRRMSVFLGILLSIVSALSLSQDIFNYSLGIDNLFVTAWPLDQDIHPGRMAPITAAAFFITGLIFIILPYTWNKICALLVQVFIFLLLFLGLSALIGHLFILEFLYTWFRYSPMALHTSIGIVLLSIGLIIIWSRSEAYQLFYKDKEDRKILLLCSAIIFFAVYITGVTSFAIVENYNELQLKNRLQKNLQNSANIFQISIANSLQSIKTLIDSVSYSPHLSLAPNHFSGIYISDANNKSVYKTGYLIQNPSFEILLNLSYNAKLLWKNGWFIQYSTIDSKKNHLVAQWPLTDINLIFNYYPSYNKNSEIMICGLQNPQKAICFSSRLGQSLFALSFSEKDQLLNIIYNGLSNKQGVKNITDYRGNTAMAAYTPFNDLGLTMIIKNNLVDIYRPIRGQLERILSILLLGMITSIIFIYWQVRPLLRKVILSGKEALAQKTLLEKAEEKLTYQAHHDPLTGLVNREQLSYDLRHIIAFAKRRQLKFAILFLDIDYFKKINDNLGHDVGDLLLQRVAERLQKHCRATDVVARMGGDEFIIVLTDIDSSNAAALFAENLINTIRNPIKIHKHQINITISIGISIYPDNDNEIHGLLKKSDLALYQVKNAGRNSYRFFTGE